MLAAAVQSTACSEFRDATNRRTIEERQRRIKQEEQAEQDRRIESEAQRRAWQQQQDAMATERYQWKWCEDQTDQARIVLSHADAPQAEKDQAQLTIWRCERWFESVRSRYESQVQARQRANEEESAAADREYQQRADHGSCVRQCEMVGNQCIASGGSWGCIFQKKRCLGTCE